MNDADKLVREHLIEVMNRMPRIIPEIAREIRAAVLVAQKENEKARDQIARAEKALELLQETVYDLVNTAQQVIGIKVLWDITQENEDDECQTS